MFKALRRLTKKGTENGVLHIERMLMLCTHAAPKCFPGFVQPVVAPGDWEDVSGHTGLSEIRSILPRIDRT